MTNFERTYEKELAVITAARWAAWSAAGIGYDEDMKALPAVVAEDRVSVTITPGPLRYHQRRLERAFGTSSIGWLRAMRPRHPLVRAAIKAAHKAAKVPPEAVAQHRRNLAALRSPLPRHAKSLRRMLGTTDIHKAAVISYDRYCSQAVAGHLASAA